MLQIEKNSLKQSLTDGSNKNQPLQRGCVLLVRKVPSGMLAVLSQVPVLSATSCSRKKMNTVVLPRTGSRGHSKSPDQKGNNDETTNIRPAIMAAPVTSSLNKYAHISATHIWLTMYTNFHRR